jgi:ADP-ribosylglycohydrolase
MPPPSRPATRSRILGTLFGHAVGDALGLGAEGLTRAQVARHYPAGLRGYDGFVRDPHRAAFAPGEWTDDTALMLHLLDSLLARRRVDAADIARRFHRWAADDSRGIGFTTARVLGDPAYLDAPQAAALRVWRADGGEIASNGAVMRTSVLGLWHLGAAAPADAVARDAAAVCRLTHADARCVASCVAVSVAVARLAGGATPDTATADATRAADAHWSGFAAWIDDVVRGPLEALHLEGDPAGAPLQGSGDTLRTVGAGFWALANAPSFADGVLRVIHEGGDADTNAAVAGALLGAREGVAAIPARWIDGLRHGAQLRQRGAALWDCVKPRAQQDA